VNSNVFPTAMMVNSDAAMLVTAMMVNSNDG
jgi:hypothetical protein